MLRFAKPAVLAVTLLVLSTVAVQAATPISIAAARKMPLGTVVTVEGSVTVPSGTFASSFQDEGFAIQDLTAGIYVSTADNLGLRLRQRALVTGTLMDNGGLLILVPSRDSDVTVEGRGAVVLPRFVRTAAVGEATEGLIVMVVGRITRLEGDEPYGQKVFVNDGSGEIRVFINNGAHIDVSRLHTGQPVAFIGFSGQFDDYEVDPRFPSDLLAF